MIRKNYFREGNSRLEGHVYVAGRGCQYPKMCGFSQEICSICSKSKDGLKI